MARFFAGAARLPQPRGGHRMWPWFPRLSRVGDTYCYCTFHRADVWNDGHHGHPQDFFTSDSQTSPDRIPSYATDTYSQDALAFPAAAPCMVSQNLTWSDGCWWCLALRTKLQGSLAISYPVIRINRIVMRRFWPGLSNISDVEWFILSVCHVFQLGWNYDRTNYQRDRFRIQPYRSSWEYLMTLMWRWFCEPFYIRFLRLRNSLFGFDWKQGPSTLHTPHLKIPRIIVSSPYQSWSNCQSGAYSIFKELLPTGLRSHLAVLGMAVWCLRLSQASRNTVPRFVRRLWEYPTNAGRMIIGYKVISQNISQILELPGTLCPNIQTISSRTEPLHSWHRFTEMACQCLGVQ